MKPHSFLVPAALGLLAAAAHVAPAAQSRAQSAAPSRPTGGGDAVRGARLYQACMGCHALDENDVGPLHRGVVGRAAAAVPGYAYSAALRRSNILWTPANLDHWLTSPQAMVPGSKMYFSIPAAQDRRDIIAFLGKNP